MKQLVTSAIILSRTDYGEANRILTLLTPDYGKLSLMAKGVRRVKSKLAGGIELFSESEITFIKGRGEVGTLVSARLKRHHKHIVTDLDRTMVGYELIRQLHKATEHGAEKSYFGILEQAFEALDDTSIPLQLIRFWFMAQLLRLGGHSPNLYSDDQGQKLTAERQYTFDPERMLFAVEQNSGVLFNAAHIKLLRLTFAGNKPAVLAQIQHKDALLARCLPLVQTMRQAFIRT